MLKINRLYKTTLNALWKNIGRGMERLQNAKYLYSLAKVVLVHPHIPESSYTKGTATAGDQLRVSGAFTTGKRGREVFNLPARILLEGNENTFRAFPLCRRGSC